MTSLGDVSSVSVSIWHSETRRSRVFSFLLQSLSSLRGPVGRSVELNTTRPRTDFFFQIRRKTSPEHLQGTDDEYTIGFWVHTPGILRGSLFSLQNVFLSFNYPKLSLVAIVPGAVPKKADVILRHQLPLIFAIHFQATSNAHNLFRGSMTLQLDPQKTVSNQVRKRGCCSTLVVCKLALFRRGSLMYTLLCCLFRYF